MTYKDHQNPYEVVVNGFTGKSAGTAPRDWLVEVLSVAIVLAIAGGLVYGAIRLAGTLL
jgi:hypothetical protein